MMNASPKTSVEAIAESIAYRITRFELPAGQRLTEERLSREFGVSRTPIREALRMLEQAGYVVRAVPRGYAVRGLDLAAIDGIFTVRAVLEDLSIQLAAPTVGTQAFEDLKAQALQAVESLEVQDDHHVLREAFHEQLAALSSNTTLVRLLRDLDAHIYVTRRLDSHVPARALTAQQEHLRIVQLLESGEISEARSAMREHIEHSQSIVRGLMASGIASVSFVAPRAERVSEAGGL